MTTTKPTSAIDETIEQIAERLLRELPVARTPAIDYESGWIKLEEAKRIIRELETEHAIALDGALAAIKIQHATALRAERERALEEAATICYKRGYDVTAQILRALAQKGGNK